MSDWPVVRISELATIDIGGTPSRAIPAFWAEKPNGYPWISIADLKGKYVRDTKEHITALGVRSSNVKLIPERTTVMSFKLTVGRTAITAREMYCNEAIAIFQPKDGRLEAGWLYHALPGAAADVVTDTAVKGATLNKAKMAEMPLRLPPPAEQTIIARVLDTLDTAIHETEAIIAKLKAVKQGLLHDLLTRGIDANGELRPPQAEAPHLYKQSPLGWIPREWTVEALASRISSLDAGVSVNSEDRPHGAGEIGVLKTSALSHGQFLPAQNKTVVARELPFVRETVLGDSILVSRMNTPELVGASCYVSESWPTLFLPDRIWQLKRFLPDSVDMRWLSFVFLTPRYRAYVQVHATGTSGTMKNLPKSKLLAMRVAFPDTDEQKAIANRMKSADQRIAVETAGLEKLRAQKAGLMDDLLTGRVRVTPLLAD